MEYSLSIDTLAKMDESELSALHGRLQSELSSALKNKYGNIMSIESDICFVQRELDIRETRRRKHAIYVQRFAGGRR